MLRTSTPFPLKSDVNLTHHACEGTIRLFLNPRPVVSTQESKSPQKIKALILQEERCVPVGGENKTWQTKPVRLEFVDSQTYKADANISGYRCSPNGVVWPTERCRWVGSADIERWFGRDHCSAVFDLLTNDWNGRKTKFAQQFVNLSLCRSATGFID